MENYTGNGFFTRGFGKKIAMVDLCYPYGHQKIYLSGSLFTAAARFWNSGFDIEIIDFNIDQVNSSRVKSILNKADIIAVSVVGSPYIQELVRFCRSMKITNPSKPVLLGGQVMKGFSREQFKELFDGTDAVLVTSDQDLERFGIPPESLPDSLEVAFKPILERMSAQRLKLYLSTEMPLVLSQGCRYSCNFCAADVGKPEEFKDIGCFVEDLTFMANSAKDFGLDVLKFYSTSLDFFQTPAMLESYLKAISSVKRETGIKIELRALSCVVSYLHADRQITNLSELLHDAGFYSVGFGIDGPNKEIWETEGKSQNREDDIPMAMQRTAQMGISAEILMIMGDKRYDIPLLIKTILFCYRFIFKWNHTLLRLHVAKVLPASKDWVNSSPDYIKNLIAKPSLFINLDVLALASKTTHPERKERWQTNLSYMAIFLPLRLAKRCISSLILPQGGKGFLPWIARKLNPYMPYDR